MPAADGGRSVIDVQKDSAAAAAGLAVGDIIATLDGQPMTGREAFNRAMAGKLWGDVVRLGITRGGEQKTLDVPLRRTQKNLGRASTPAAEDEGAHISGPELLHGIREFALEQFGLLARTVLRCWGIHSTDDFGRMVFELIDRGEMRKTDGDQITDFYGVYNFEDAFEREYQLDVSQAF